MPRILVVDDNPELLKLLSSAFEDAGYTVQTATRGKAAIELARKEKPDLAVIDVLLPDVMGFEVGEALQKQKVPVAFMSGVHKGGKAASNATFKYGAAGYFEKPFERRALLDLVEKLVPVRPAGNPPAWDVDPAEGVEGPGDEMELTGRIELTSGGTTASISGAPVNLRELPKAVRQGSRPGTARVAPPVLQPQAPAKAIYTSAVSIPPTPRSQLMPPPPPPPDDLAIEVELPKIAAAAALEAASRGQPGTPANPISTKPIPGSSPGIPRPVRSLGQQSSPGSLPPPPPIDAMTEPPQKGSVHRGEIDDNLPQLFAAFLAAQETGELGLSRGAVKKIVYFEKGMPVFALSNLVAERLGQFLVRAGKIDEQTLKHALAEANETSQRTGDVLILMGLLTEQERLYYVGQQIKSILYSLFAWTDGQYHLSFADRARKETIKLDIHPATLVLRGIKKLYKPERLRKILSPDDRVMPGGDPLFSLSDVELQGWEALMVARCDGTRPVRELIALSQKPELEALGTLVALVSMRVLEKRR